MKKSKLFSFILLITFIISFCFNNQMPSSKVLASEDVTRIYGATRFETSYAIADIMKDSMRLEEFSSVIVTDGMNYPDALAGSYLAAKMNAPILMVNTDNASSIKALKLYIKNTLAKDGTIYILGGTGAVSDIIKEELSGYTFKRLSGNNRYNTNLEILKEATIADEPILVCTGEGFADSLSASATGLPILLVGDKLTEEQKTFLTDKNGNPLYIIGGSAAISEEVEAELQTYGSTERISGKSRFETSVLLAETFFADADKAVIAYAWNFPDGLCGGPLAYSISAPLILTGADMSKSPDEAAELLSATTAMNYTNQHQIYTGAALGGTGVLTDYTVRLVFDMFADAPITSVKYVSPQEDDDSNTPEDSGDSGDPKIPANPEIPEEPEVPSDPNQPTEPEEPTGDNYVVVLDPGHGGAGSGAFRDWNTFVIDEAVINYKLSQYTKNYLEENYEDVEVYITKSTLSENPSLKNRVQFGVEKEADVFVSQHVNSSGEQLTTATGVFALVPTVDSTHTYHKDVALEAQSLARNLLEQLAAIGWNNRGFSLRLSGDNTRYPDGSLADYYGIVKGCREAQIPGFIMEHGFCNNLSDAQKLSDEEMLKKTGEADAIGIANYLGLNAKEIVDSEEH